VTTMNAEGFDLEKIGGNLD